MSSTVRSPLTGYEAVTHWIVGVGAVDGAVENEYVEPVDVLVPVAFTPVDTTKNPVMVTGVPPG